ncbi:uncharacterized protein A4U43_C09F1090 [Asparagus officinalis]|uniref:DUF1279 domain-containing protein n=1 Tax=Asparagus officinalis TaxID=4686 RepID=A0A5P1E7N8_ASPOF|nr:uncharacterized protein A4U43_C09F1090 [Asparagus officinalis]
MKSETPTDDKPGKRLEKKRTLRRDSNAVTVTSPPLSDPNSRAETARKPETSFQSSPDRATCTAGVWRPPVVEGGRLEVSVGRLLHEAIPDPDLDGAADGELRRRIFSSKSEGDGEEKSKADQAKELLTKYGGAYLATSITLSLISFALCYALVSAGIDVQALLAKVGIAADETGGKVGTFALAYAAHKAASPIRFPPTVALTPIVAGWIGKKTDKADK